MHINSSDEVHMPSIKQLRPLGKAYKARQAEKCDLSLQRVGAKAQRAWHMCPSGLELNVNTFRDELDKLYIKHLQHIFAKDQKASLVASEAWYEYAEGVVALIQTLYEGTHGAAIAKRAAARAYWYLVCSNLHGFLPFITKTFLHDIGSLLNRHHTQIGVAEVSVQSSNLFPNPN